ncbi:MAG: helix-turn-helix domain-containing protein [Chloroflexi bacterium]|nr:helix-turn-helix domain-containing protein [Chloroflexota bacterium]
MAKPPSDWVTLAEASAILASANIGVSPSTLGRWAREGRIQSTRPGRLIYVRRSQIRAMLLPRGHAGVPDVPLPAPYDTPGQASLFSDLDD